MLSLIPTYLIQLPILSLYLFLSLISPAAQHFLHHPVPRAIIISPLSNCACILPDPPYSTLGPSNISQPKGTAGHAPTPLWWENIETSPDSWRWVPESYTIWEVSCLMSLQPLVMQKAPQSSVQQPHWPFQTHTRWCVFHTQLISYTWNVFSSFSFYVSFIFFSLHFHCCIFKLKFLDSPYFLQLFDF